MPQLFWIVKNGVRLSGMPAFGSMETDERILALRSIRAVITTGSNPVTFPAAQVSFKEEPSSSFES